MNGKNAAAELYGPGNQGTLDMEHEPKNGNQVIPYPGNGNGGSSLAQVHAVGVEAVVHQQEMVHEILTRVLRKGVHYGTVPGCGERLTLLKPGAEKILSCFGIRPEIHVENLATTPDEIHYRVTAKGYSATGAFMGDGVGECSTLEPRRRWRKVFKTEYDAAGPEGRNIRTGPKGTVYQVRAEAAPNTLLKVAKKRALVDLCMTVTACSDIFENRPNSGGASAGTRDPGGKQNGNGGSEHQGSGGGTQDTQTQDTHNAAEPPTPINEKQRRLLFAKAHEHAWPQLTLKEMLFHNFDIESTRDIPAVLFNEILEQVEAGPRAFTPPKDS